MGWALSLLYFGLPALAMIIGFYVGMPWLERRGLMPYMAYMVSMGLPLLGLLVAALVAYRLEGHPWTWRALLDRFRYQSMTGAEVTIVDGRRHIFYTGWSSVDVPEGFVVPVRDRRGTVPAVLNLIHATKDDH